MKVIIDTNILISAAFRGGKPKMAIAHVIASSSLEWIASSEIIQEYKEVLNRPKLKLSQITKRKRSGGGRRAIALQSRAAFGGAPKKEIKI